METVQESVTRKLNYPRNLVFDIPSNSLIIPNNRAHSIVRWALGAVSWTIAAGNSSGLPGNTPTSLNYPTGTVFDTMGNMYVADEGNQRIQLFLVGQFSGTTVAGVTGSAGSAANLLNTPSAVAVDDKRNLYVANYANSRVQKCLH